MRGDLLTPVPAHVQREMDRMRDELRARELWLIDDGETLSR